MMTMSWKCWMLSAAVFATGLAACGDDDDAPPPPPADMGVDVDMNTPPVDMGTPDDAGPADAGPPSGQCDPWDETSCAAPNKCAVVIRNSGLPNAAVTFECVPAAAQRREGQVCNFADLPGGTRVDGGNVDFYDLCEQGTFCWDTPPIPGFPPQPRSCRPLCGAEGVFCGDTEYCALLNADDPATTTVEPTFGVCTPAVGCDPVFQTGCTIPGDACYIVSSTRGDLLGACLEVNRDADAGTPFAPGTACDFATQCAPGAGCLPTIEGGDFGMGARACREYCQAGGMGGGFGGGTDMGLPDVDAGDADAGAGEADAGAGDVDAGDADAGAGDVDAGEPDLGPPDLGPPDLGPPDLGPPDLGTDAGPPRTGLCPPSLSCVAFPVGDPDAGTMIRFATNPGLCQ